MKQELEKLQKDFKKSVYDVKDVLKLDEVYQRFFSRKSGEMTNIMKNLKELTGDARKEIGKLANEVKGELEYIYGKKKESLENQKWEKIAQTEKIDISQPKLPKKRKGHLHPMTIVHNELEDLFTSMGFMVLDGPELESDY